VRSIDRTPATTEIVAAQSRPSTAGTDEAVASHLVARAARRLEIVCIAATVSLAVLWLGVVTALGKLGEELAAARSRRLTATTLVRVGLVYEVAVSFAIACGSYLGAFEGVTGRSDRGPSTMSSRCWTSGW
jgi:hypothetical protein